MNISFDEYVHMLDAELQINGISGINRSQLRRDTGDPVDVPEKTLARLRDADQRRLGPCRPFEGSEDCRICVPPTLKPQQRAIIVDAIASALVEEYQADQVTTSRESKDEK